MPLSPAEFEKLRKLTAKEALQALRRVPLGAALIQAVTRVYLRTFSHQAQAVWHAIEALSALERVPQPSATERRLAEGLRNLIADVLPLLGTPPAPKN